MYGQEIYTQSENWDYNSVRYGVLACRELVQQALIALKLPIHFELDIKEVEREDSEENPINCICVYARYETKESEN